MIVADVNVLVYAFRLDSEHFETYHRWLPGVLGGPESFAIVEHCLAGFVRIVTNPRIYDVLAPIALALEFVRRIRVARNATPIAANSATWELLGEWVSDDDRIVDNLLPDAVLAALTLSHGARFGNEESWFRALSGSATPRPPSRQLIGLAFSPVSIALGEYPTQR